MDFALATSEAEQQAPLFGAPAYMAPDNEVWEGQPPDAASDQFALAALA